MQLNLAVAAAAIAILSAAAMSGCESDEDILPPVVVHTPLDIDPLAPITISEWWSNGREMLRLKPDESYEFYADQNRYHAPAQRGRWSKPSYAWLRLEPYTRLRTEIRRASIEKIDGRVALVLLKLDPMFALARPPVMLEDHVLGGWSGAVGELLVVSGGRYRYYPMPDEFGQPAQVAGHQGRWRIEGDRLLLQPEPSGIDRIEMTVERDGDTFMLHSPDGPLQRTDPAAAPET